MENTLSKIDKFVNDYKALLPLKPEYQRKLDEKFRLEFNFNSNHLEGNTLTYGQTKLLLIFDKTTGDHEMREYEEMKAHDAALKMIKELAKDKEHPLTESFIRQLNEIILVRPFWKEAITPDGQTTRREITPGEYKKYPNSVRLANGEIYNYPSPEQTSALMSDLMKYYQEEITKKDMNPVVLAAMMHYKLVCIHPFDDGNGRVARLLMNYILLKYNYPPIIIKTEKKKEYLTALNKADVGDVNSLIKFIAEQLVYSLELSLKAAKGEDIEEPEDLDKKFSILEKEIEAIDPEKEVKILFSVPVFFEMYNTWISDLLRIIIPEIQKINKFFVGPSHGIIINTNIAFISYVDEDTEDIIDKLLDEIRKNIGNIGVQETNLVFKPFFGAFKKGGLNTFGCSYGFTIKFDYIKYEVYVDLITDNGLKDSVKKYERLLNKPLSIDEINDIVKTLKDTIYKHIDFMIKENGIR